MLGTEYFCSPQIWIKLEDLVPSMAVFGDGAFKELIKVGSYKDGVLIW